jgi:hypothetical protein
MSTGRSRPAPSIRRHWAIPRRSAGCSIGFVQRDRRGRGHQPTRAGAGQNGFCSVKPLCGQPGRRHPGEEAAEGDQLAFISLPRSRRAGIAVNLSPPSCPKCRRCSSLATVLRPADVRVLVQVFRASRRWRSRNAARTWSVGRRGRWQSQVPERLIPRLPGRQISRRTSGH